MSETSSRRKWTVSAIVVLAAVVIVTLMMATRPEPPDAVTEERAWPIATVSVEPREHRPRLQLQGFLESPRTVTLKAAVEADVARIEQYEGESVLEDGLILKLDEADTRLALDQREGDVAELEAQQRIEQRRVESDRNELAIERELLELARREAQRLRDLSDQQHVSQSDLERANRELERQKLAVSSREFAVDTAEERLQQAEARLKRARAARDRAELNLQRTDIRAPFDARVASLETAPGDRVAPGTPLARIYALDHLEIRAQAPSAWLPRLRASMNNGDLEAKAHIDGETVPLTLSRLAGQAQRGQGGAQALFRVNGQDHDLVLGRFADVHVELSPEPDTYLLPFEALYETDRIYRVRNKRLAAVQVETRGRSPLPDGRPGVLVHSPQLQGEETILATQLPQAMDRLRVQITNPDES